MRPLTTDVLRGLLKGGEPPRISLYQPTHRANPDNREVLARFSRPSGLPLILAALPEYHAEFRRTSRNPFLQPDGVAKDPGSLTPEQLRAEVWQVVEPKYLARLAQLTKDHQTAAARGMAASNLDDVAQTAAAERIGMLLIEADRVIPGRFDPATGEVRLDRLADPDVDDLIDDLAEAVLRTGGEVVVVPAGRMPTDTGLAATFRHSSHRRCSTGECAGD